MKRIIVFAMIVFSLCTSYYRDMRFKQISDEAALVKSFQFSGADVLQTKIDCTAKIDDEVWDVDKLKTVALQTIEELIPQADISPTEINSSDLMTDVKISGSDKNNEFVYVDLYSQTANNAPGTYITVSVVKEREFRNIAELKTRIDRALKTFNPTPQIDICIVGTYDGKLDEANLERLKHNMLEPVKAKKVNSKNDENVIAVTAYSPIIKGMPVKSDCSAHASNISITIRYNSLENKTYIQLTVPNTAI